MKIGIPISITAPATSGESGPPPETFRLLREDGGVMLREDSGDILREDAE
jgi:hypothetical protein